MVLEGRLTLTRWDTKKDQLASASFPLFATAWGYLKEAPSAEIDKDDAGETETKTNPPKLTVLLAGGGGSGATGVRNCLVCCEPQPPKQGETRPTFKELSRLNTGAETVGTVSISPKGDVIAVGIGDHCGIFKVAPNLKLSLFGCFKADFAEEESDMKAARFNASASILATCWHCIACTDAHGLAVGDPKRKLCGLDMDPTVSLDYRKRDGRWVPLESVSKL